MESVQIFYAGEGKNTVNLSPDDSRLVLISTVNSSFGGNQTEYIELFIYGEDGSLLSEDYNASDYYPGILYNPQSNAYSNLLLDPEKDLKNRGFNRGKLNIQYNFYRPIFNSTLDNRYWIKQISPSRKEIKLASQLISDDSISSGVNQYRTNASSVNYYPVFYLNFGQNNLVMANNVLYGEDDQGGYMLVKLYEPLPTQFRVKTSLWIVDKIAESVSYDVNISVESETTVVRNSLRGPNYSVKVNSKGGQTTPYYNYSNLLLSPVTSSYQKLKSFYQDKSIDLNIDYSNFVNFVHFSSAVQRVNNFVYKLQQIEAAEANIAAQLSIAGGGSIVSSSVSVEQQFIDNVIKNFDIYEYFLYFESSSFAWPKSNSTQPYTLYSVSSSQAQNFLGSETTVPTAGVTSLLFSASYYDSTNKDTLRQSAPQYILDDPNNQPYVTFLDMIGQHFDNIWVYYKDVSNRYVATNNPNTGISLDLVSDALRGLGMQLYTNTNVSDNLYYTMFGINPDGSLLPPTGSEWITNYVTSSLTTLPAEQLQDEVYKRLYHNLPYLLKTKGTARGVKTLIQSYGIPESMLRVREFGGNPYNEINGVLDMDTSDHYKIIIDTGSLPPPPTFVMSEILEYIQDESTDFIVTDYPIDQGTVTGSLTISSSLLSPYTTLQYYAGNRRLNNRNVEVGFSPSDTINAEISASQGTFVIDQLIGSPGYRYSSSYEPLVSASDAYFSSYTQPNSIWEYVRLLKFYNNSLFKIIKDFVPARANLSTGIIIKSHLYERNKYARHEPSMSFELFSQSIDMINITASDGGSVIGDTVSSGYVITTSGSVFYVRTQGEEKYNGELSGSYLQVTSGKEFPQFEISQLPAPFVYNEVFVSESGGDYIVGESSGPPPIPDPENAFILTEDQIGNPYYLTPLYALYQNISGSVRSKVLLDLDFSGNQQKPINYGAITYSISQSQIDNYATYMNPNNPYAEVQDYNYNLRRSVIPRYSGSRTVSSTYNDYTPGDSSYGKTAAIDKIKYQYAYITDIYSSSFQMPFRAKGQIKYIIDNNQNVINLSRNNINLFVVQNIFKSGEYADVSLFDYNPTNPYIQKLNNSANDFTIWESGYSYTPLIYNNSGSLIYLLDQVITLPGAPGTPSTITTLGPSDDDYWSSFTARAYNPGGIAIIAPFTASAVVNSPSNNAVTINYYLTSQTPGRTPSRYPSSGNATVIIPAGTQGTGCPNCYRTTVYLGSSYSTWAGDLLNVNVVSETVGTSGTPAGAPTITSSSLDLDPSWKVISPGNVVLISATQSLYYSQFTSTGSYTGLEAFVFPFEANRMDLVRLYNYSTSRWDSDGEFRITSVQPSYVSESVDYVAFTMDRVIPLEYTTGSTNYPLKVDKYLLLKRLQDETSIYFNYNLPQPIPEDGTLFPQYIGEDVKENSGNVIKALKQQNLI